MMTVQELTAAKANEIFNRAIDDYHKTDDIHAKEQNPFAEGTIESLLYRKNWIDTVQWHLEDEVRAPNIADASVVHLKRWIDRSNQDRNDTVEKIDDWYLTHFRDIKPSPDARLNSESPAWILDRMSIICLKIYHMRLETQRSDATDEHRKKCENKLNVLLEQQSDLGRCLEEYIGDILAGTRMMKVYRQMKMYNDESLNPVLYQKGKSN
nr:DUF4254 domain-containing protein [Leptonema illini]